MASDGEDDKGRPVDAWEDSSVGRVASHDLAEFGVTAVDAQQMEQAIISRVQCSLPGIRFNQHPPRDSKLR
jgi:hypothetical protein